MTGFICHDDYLNKTSKLSDEELGRLFRACMKYHATGEEQDLDGRESIAFDFIREDIDRSEKAYQTKCETNRKNRLSKMTNDDEREQPSTVDDEREQPSIIKEKEKEEENIKENNKEKKSKGGKPERLSIPPTVEEVAAYCKERGNGIDAEYFCAYYGKQNWRLSNGQRMTNWKMAVITWEKRDKESPPHPRPAGKIVSAQMYTQRDYNGQQESPEDMMKRLAAMGAG